MNNTQKLVLTSMVLMGLIMTPMPFASADQVTVSLPSGSSVPGCEKTQECYIPYRVTVNPGDEVVWSNDDTAAHTVTSGTAADGPDGLFDSSLFMAAATFSHTFDTLGEYNYFCMVHPWMVGQIFVTVGGADVEKDLGTITIGSTVEPIGTLVVEAPSTEETTVTGMSSDGKVRVEITSSNPSANESMSIDLKFRDSGGGGIKQHANYNIVAVQNDKEILSFMGAHEHKGNGMHSTAPLTSSDAVDIQVTLLGFGLPGDEVNWTGSTGEILYFNVVPEFGTIAVMILAVTITSIIIVSAKSKLNIMPRL